MLCCLVTDTWHPSIHIWLSEIRNDPHPLENSLLLRGLSRVGLFFPFHCCLMCNKNDWLFLFPCAICRKSPRLWLALSNFWTHLFCFFTFLLMLSGALNFLSRFPSRHFCLFAWRLLCFMRLRRTRLMCDSWFVDFPSLLEFAATSLNSFCRLMCIFGFLLNLVCCFPHPPFFVLPMRLMLDRYSHICNVF